MSCDSNNGGESLSRKKKRVAISRNFSALYGSGRNLYRWACIECGTQHWYSGCQKVEWRDWTLVAEGVGAYLFTKTRGDPPKNGLIPRHWRVFYEGRPGNYLANHAKARTQLPKWQRNAIGRLPVSCLARIFQNLAHLFAAVTVYLALRPFRIFARPSFAQFLLGIADLVRKY